MLTVLLGSALKIEGRFILQTQTDGPVRMLVVDYPQPRAGARLRALRRGAGGGGDRGRQGHGRRAARPRPSGHDHRPGRRHEPLPGPGRARGRRPGGRRARIFPAARSRFRRGCGSRSARNCRPAPAIAGAPAACCCSFCPRRRSALRMADLDPGDAPEGTPVHEVAEDDAWVEGRSLIATVEDVELIDPALSSERLVYRLFHERGVRVFRRCRCRRAMLVLARRRRGDAAKLFAGRPRPHGGERRDLGDLRVLQRELPVRASRGGATAAR